MGLCVCTDKITPRNSIISSFKFQSTPSDITATNESNKCPLEIVVVQEDFATESSNVCTNHISIPNRQAQEEKRNFARTLPIATGADDMSKRARNKSFHISYISKSQVEEQTILVDEELVDALMTTLQVREPVVKNFSLSRRSMNRSVFSKTPKFNEHITINRIASSDMAGSKAKSEVYKMIILLREIWAKLDLDNDKHLNMAELKRFCIAIWEEPVEDGGASVIMPSYAKLDPKKGLNFNEWCLLIKDNDPDLQQFVEDIYEIFVDTASHSDLVSEDEHESPTSLGQT